MRRGLSYNAPASEGLSQASESAAPRCELERMIRTAKLFIYPSTVVYVCQVVGLAPRHPQAAPGRQF